jgi:hypothetical protein
MSMSSVQLLGLFAAVFSALLASLALVVLSVSAYRRSRHRSFTSAAVGFGLVTIGLSIEIVYQLFVRGPYLLGGGEVVGLQTAERFVVAAGLLVLLYSIVRY